MSIRTIFALSAAIVLSIAATASAATKKQKSLAAAHRLRPSPHAPPHFSIPTVPRPQAVVPLATIKCSSAIELLVNQAPVPTDPRRAHRERPGRRGAAEQRDELAPM